MLEIDPDAVDDQLQALLEELLSGGGAILLRGAFCAADVAEARELINYVPKFVAPLEDQRAGVRSEVVERATPTLRRLMGFDYPYPKLFDEAEAKVQIGRDTLGDGYP